MPTVPDGWSGTPRQNRSKSRYCRLSGIPGPVLWIPVSESQFFLNLTLAVNVKKIS